MRLVVLGSVAFVVVACTGGGDTTGTSSGASTADGGSTSSSGTTGGSSSGGSSSSGGTSSSSGGGSSSGNGGCVGTRTTLVKYGQTSSCSHLVPVTYDPNMINVYYSSSPGVMEKLCQTSRTSCEQWKGWFFIGEEIAFCDETCSKIDASEEAQFLVETGCPTTDCF